MLRIPKNLGKAKLNVPFIGWNKINIKKNNLLFKDIKTLNFYFTHSYYVKPQKNEIIHSYTDYNGFKFCSSINWRQTVSSYIRSQKRAIFE